MAALGLIRRQMYDGAGNPLSEGTQVVVKEEGSSSPVRIYSDGEGTQLISSAGVTYTDAQGFVTLFATKNRRYFIVPADKRAENRTTFDIQPDDWYDLSTLGPTAGSGFPSSGTTPDASVFNKGIVQLSGDLGGTALNPTVEKIKGLAIQGTPTAGTILSVSGPSTATWTSPAALNLGANDASTSAKGVVQLTGDIGGTASGVTVERIKGIVLPSTAPTVGQVLQATSPSTSAWATLPSSTATPDASSVTNGVVRLAGDLAGVAAAPVVAKLQGVVLTNTPTSVGQVLTAVTTGTAAWATPSGSGTPVSDATTSAKGIVQLTNDLGGTAAAPTVEKIKGLALPATAPTTGQVLTATSGTALSWASPAAGAGNATTSTVGVVQLGGDLAGLGSSATAPKVSGLQGVQVSATSPVTGYVLTATSANSAAWAAAAAVTGDATTSVKGVIQLAGDISAGTASAPLVTGLRGVSVAATAPTAGQVLTATSGSAASWATPSNSVTVENVLTSTSAVNALSANMGKVLNDRLVALEDPAVVPITGNVTIDAANRLTYDNKVWRFDVAATVTIDVGAKIEAICTPPASGSATIAFTGGAQGNGSTSSITRSAAEGLTFAVLHVDTDKYIVNGDAATVSDATTSIKGLVQLAGDLGGTASAPSVLKVNGISVANGPTAGQVLTALSSTSANWQTLAGSSTDATTSVKGIVQLSGDLGGTATAPLVNKLQGVTLSGTPTTGQVLTATSGTAASWSAPVVPVYVNNLVSTSTTSALAASQGPVIQSALDARVQLGGDLSGTVTAPIVDKVKGVSMPTSAPTAGQVLTATSGSATGWATPAAATFINNLSSTSTTSGLAAAQGPVIQTALDTKVQVGGDLSGTVASPIVDKLRGVAVPSTAPTAGQVLTATSASATSWQNVRVDATSVSKGEVQLAGDLSGTATIPLVAKLNGVSVPGTAPTAGQVLTATSGTATSWSTLPDSSGAVKGIVQLAGDLAGTAAAPVVDKLRGVTLSATAPTAGQVLTATSGTAASWSTPAAGAGDATTLAKGVVQLGGDLAGAGSTAAAPKVSGFQGVTVSTTAPSVGQVLTATSASAAGWSTPAAGAGDATTLAKGVVQLAGDIAGTASSVTVTGVRGVAVAATAPTANQVLTATSGTTAGWAALPVTSIPDATTAAKGVVQLANDLGGTHLAPAVIGIRSVAVSATAPTAGQVLTATSGSAASWTSLPAATDATSSVKGVVQLTTDLGGTSASPSVVGIRGVAVGATAPTAGQVLTASSGVAASWSTLPDATSTVKGVVQLTGDLGGTAASPTVTKLGGVSLPGSAPTTGQVLAASSGTALTWTTLAGAVDATTSTKGQVQLAGDLAGGTAAAPIVTGVRGVAVSATAPTAGQVLTATSGTAASWATPAAGAGDATTLAKGVVQLAGDLSGSGTAAATPRVSGLQGISISATAPTTGQVLTASSSVAAAWATPSTADATTLAKGIVQLSGDLGGTASAPSVLKINGVTISGAPTSTRILMGTSATTASWATPTQASTSGLGVIQLAGDIAGGTSTSPIVTGLRGVALAATAPTAGQVLTATSGTAAGWAAAAVATDATTLAKGVVQLAGDLAGTAAAPLVAKMQGVDVPTAAPTAGQILVTTSATAMAWEDLVKSYVTVSASRNLAASDDGKILVCSSAITLTIPAGLTFKQGCAVIPPSSGVVTVTAAAGVSGNGSVASSTTRSLADNASGFGIIYLGTTDAWGISGSDGPATVTDATTSVKGVIQLAGDLAGTAATPEVAKLKGVSLGATAPTAGQVLTATSGTAASWSSSPSASLTQVGVVDLADNQVLGTGRKVIDLVSIGSGASSLTNRANLMHIGSNTLTAATNTADYVVVVGPSAGAAVTDATHVTAMGASSGLLLTTGSRNAFQGSFAGSKATTASDLTLIGYGVMGGTASGTVSRITAVGSANAANATGSEFSSFGYQSAANYSGTYGTIMGNSAASSASGNHIVALGNASARTAGNFVVAVGSQSAETSASTFTNMTLIGHVCGQHVRGNQVTFAGRSAGQYVTANQNSGFGAFTLQLTDTTLSSALGYAAGRYGMGNTCTYLGANTGPSKGASVGTAITVTVTAAGTVSFSPALSVSTGKVVVTAVTAGTWTDVGAGEEFPVTVTSATTGTVNTGFASAAKIGLTIASADVNSLSTFNNITCVGGGSNAVAANQVALGNSSVTSLLMAGNLLLDITGIAAAADGTPIVKRTSGGRPVITV